MHINRWRKSIIAILVTVSISARQSGDKNTPTYNGITPVADHRGEEQTYLTLPEWYIVYISDEYAQFIKDKPPSDFSYFGSIGQMWGNYGKVISLTKNRYPFNTGYHVMIIVIATSTTVEYGFKGIYENTIGRLTELTRTHGLTQEDEFAYNMADDYVKFIRIYPWYEYNFADKFKKLWTDTDLIGKDETRKIERKLILSTEYGFKAGYGWVIKKLTKMSYDDASPVTVVLVDKIPEKLLKDKPDIKLIKQVDNNSQLASLPRYDAFKDYALLLAENGVKFKEIAGNTKELLITIIIKNDWKYNLSKGEVLFEQKIPSMPELKRIALRTPVESLNTVLLELESNKANIEHIYDY